METNSLMVFTLISHGKEKSQTGNFSPQGGWSWSPCAKTDAAPAVFRQCPVSFCPHNNQIIGRLSHHFKDDILRPGQLKQPAYVAAYVAS